MLNLTVIAQNEQFELIEKVHDQWRRYAFNRNNECDKYYYKDSIEHYVIDSVKNAISSKGAFYRIEIYGYSSKPDSITFDIAEKKFILNQLDDLNKLKWEDNLFRRSKKLSSCQIDSMYRVIRSSDTEPLNKLCYNVYTFSHPIFLRNNTICLFYNEERSFVAKEGEFSIYKLHRNEWIKYAPIYVTQE